MPVDSMEQVDLSEYRHELERADSNRQIGSRVLFENARVRIWEIDLAPGERLPFHAHHDDYFWVCVDPSFGMQHDPDGTTSHCRFEVGETEFLEIGEQPLVHDIANTGGERLRFVTVELKEG